MTAVIEVLEIRRVQDCGNLKAFATGQHDTGAPGRPFDDVVPW